MKPTTIHDHPTGLLAPLTAFYLLLPLLILAAGWLRLRLAIPTVLLVLVLMGAAGLDATAWLTGQGGQERRRLLRRRLWLLLPAVLLIMLWLLGSGIGGAGHQNVDYLVNNTMFLRLSTQPWPALVNMGGRMQPLTYYLAYFLPAALVGQFFGWQAANLAIWVWAAAGVLLAFGWFRQLAAVELRGRRMRGLILALVFMLAGGLDAIGFFILTPRPYAPTSHIEHWAGILSYSSQSTLAYWVPQHFIAAWLLTGMLAACLYRPRSLHLLAPALAAGVLWSPFGMLGLLPFVLLLAAVYLQRENWTFWLAPRPLLMGLGAGWLLLINAAYLSANAFSFASGWAWEFATYPLAWLRVAVRFWFLEVGLLAGLLLLLVWLGTRSHPVPGQARRPWNERLWRRFRITRPQFNLFIVALAWLTLVPVYRMGTYNDFVMRASMPSLLVLWAFSAKLLLDTSAGVRARHTLAYALVLMVLLLGTLSSTPEIARSIAYGKFGPPPAAQVPTWNELDQPFWATQRMGSWDKPFYHYFSKQQGLPR